MRATLRLMTARGQIRSSEIAPELTGDTVSHLASVRHTTVSMTNSTNRVEIITSVQRRRRWSAPEKVRMVRAGYDGKPGGSSAWRRPKPVVHLASAGGARRPDRGRQGGRGRAGF